MNNGGKFSDFQSLSAEETIALVVQQIAADKSGSAQKSSPFATVAEEFIKLLAAEKSSSPQQTRTEQVEETWRRFIRSRILRPFALKRQQERRLDPESSVHPYLLHYPLFAQRAVAAEVRRISPLTFAELVCRNPVAGYKEEQLWDIIARPTTAAKCYYQQIAQVLIAELTGVAEQNLFAAQQQFYQSIVSPYLDFWQSQYYFELTGTKSSVYDHDAISVVTLSIAQSILSYRLREDQCEGLVADTGQYLSPPFPAETLIYLSLLWRRKRSAAFFSTLPAEIMLLVEHQQPDLHGKLIESTREVLRQQKQQMTEFDSIHEMLRNAFQFPQEFPEVEDSAKQLLAPGSLKQGSYVAESNLQIPPELNLQSDLLAKLDLAYSDLVSDLKRGQTVKQELQLRMRVAPWERAIISREECDLNADLERIYRREIEVQQARKKLLETTAAVEKSAGELRKQSVYYVSPESEEKSIYTELPELVCAAASDQELDSQQNRIGEVFNDQRIVDPLIEGGFMVPDHRGALAEQIAAEIERTSFALVKAQSGYDLQFLDVVEIDRQLALKVPLKRLRKHFPQSLVDVVFVRNSHRDLGKSYSELKSLYPHLATVIQLLENHAKVSGSIEEICRELSRHHNLIWGQLAQTAAVAKLSAAAVLSVRAELMELLWDRIIYSIASPYRVRPPWEQPLSNRDSKLDQKRQNFYPWLEQEVARSLSVSDYELYRLIVYRRPVAVYGLSKLYNLNWDPAAFSKEYFRINAEIFLKEIYPSTLAQNLPTALFQQFAHFLKIAGSPFRAYCDFQRYGLDRLSDFALSLDSLQQRVIDSEARRAALEGWVLWQERMSDGWGGRWGTFAANVILAVKYQNPAAGVALAQAIATADYKLLCQAIERVRTAEKTSARVELPQLRQDKAELTQMLDDLDVFRLLLEVEGEWLQDLARKKHLSSAGDFAEGSVCH